MGKEQEIINAIKENNEAVVKGGKPFTVEQLADFTRQLSAKTDPSATMILLYSGPLQPDGIGDFVSQKNMGLFAWQVANKMSETNPNIGIVDKTVAMKLLENHSFRQALQNTVGPSLIQKTIFGSINPDGTRNPDGIVDDISRRFVIENPDKPIVLLAPFARPDSVYGHTELSQIMGMDGSEIEGLERHIFQDIYHSGPEGPGKTHLILSTLSREQALNLRYAFDENGHLTGVDSSDFWRTPFRELGDKTTLESHTIVTQAEMLEALSPAQRAEAAEGVRVTEEALKDVPDFSMLKRFGKNSGFVAGLGFGGITSAFTLAAGGSTTEAAEIGYESAIPYGETQLDLAKGDLAAAERSATIETFSNLGAGGGMIVGGLVGQRFGGSRGAAIGVVAGGLAGGIASGELTAFAHDHAPSVYDFFDKGDDHLLARLPTKIDENVPPELLHLVEIKRMLVETHEELALLDRGCITDGTHYTGRGELSDRLERIEQMYDEAYDTYENNGALSQALSALDAWEQAGQAAQKAIEKASTQSMQEPSVQKLSAPTAH